MARQVNNAEIGSRLKEIRKRLKVQQKVMAKILDVPASYLCDIEAGKGNPGPEFFIKLSTNYNVNLHYLIMGAGDMLTTDGEPKKVKPEAFNIADGVDNIEKLAWIMERSLYFKSMILGAANRILVTDQDVVRMNMREI
jgi:transcriptional regulator with XRE-family HTH domain